MKVRTHFTWEKYRTHSVVDCMYRWIPSDYIYTYFNRAMRCHDQYRQKSFLSLKWLFWWTSIPLLYRVRIARSPWSENTNKWTKNFQQANLAMLYIYHLAKTTIRNIIIHNLKHAYCFIALFVTRTAKEAHELELDSAQLIKSYFRISHEYKPSTSTPYFSWAHNFLQ